MRSAERLSEPAAGAAGYVMLGRHVLSAERGMRSDITKRGLRRFGGLYSALRIPHSALEWLGPVFDKELRVSSRRRRNYVLRFAYLAVLTLFVAGTWAGGVGSAGGSPSARLQQMPQVGKAVVFTVVIFQFVVLPLVAAIGLSTSISEEVHRRTLGVLMSTPVRPIQVVLGKLLSGLLQIGLLLAISLPLLIVVRLFGGVPWGFLVAGLSITLTTVLVIGCLSMLISTATRRPYVSVILSLVALFLMFALLVGFWMVVMLQMEFSSGSGSAQTYQLLELVTVCLNPYAAMVLVSRELLSPGSPGLYGWAWMVHCGLMIGVSALLILWCARRVRKVGAGLAAGETPEAQAVPPAASASDGSPLPARAPRRAARGAAIRRVTGSPVVWKELRGRFARHRALAFWLVVGASLLVVPIDVLAMIADSSWAHEAVFVILAVLLVILGIIVTAVPGATSIAAEKEAGTLELLLCSPLASGAIVLGKALGAIRRALPAWIPLAVHFVLFTVFLQAHVVVLLHVAVIVAGVLAFLTGAGLFFSTWARKTSVAVLLSVGLCVVLWGVVPIGAGMLDGLFLHRDRLSGPCLVVHPVVQSGVAAVSAAEAAAYNRDLDYAWPPPVNSTGWLGSLLLLAGTAAGYGAAGVGLTWAAVGLLRRRAP